ncbi:site-specific integrase [Nitrosophilus alvini]|uniref:site-specific integrase n=1 Tax=Nitrosophilus alvini TaxID=2714855 RepID=UPI0022798755|nr:site-specific integrase [Nitrosophilus alvini]
MLFHNKKHPANMGKDEIEEFLTHLAVEKSVSLTTQNQAFNAILFLYREVLCIDTGDWNIHALQAKRKEHLPTGEFFHRFSFWHTFYNSNLNILKVY